MCFRFQAKQKKMAARVLDYDCGSQAEKRYFKIFLNIFIFVSFRFYQLSSELVEEPETKQLCIGHGPLQRQVKTRKGYYVIPDTTRRRNRKNKIKNRMPQSWLRNFFTCYEGCYLADVFQNGTVYSDEQNCREACIKNRKAGGYVKRVDGYFELRVKRVPLPSPGGLEVAFVKPMMSLASVNFYKNVSWY